MKPVSARVRLSRSRELTPPRTHLLLRVELEGVSWLVDVGVGGLSPTCALRLVADVVQQTPHEPRRLLREGAWQGFELRAPDPRLFHQAYFADDWHDVCELTRRHADGSVESRTLMTPDELHAALTGELGLVLPERLELACADIVWDAPGG